MCKPTMVKYQIILADPPWRYENDLDNNPAYGGITYPTMSTEEIKSLPVYNIADRNCALFLWVTMPMLKNGLEVIEAWGFKYKTCAFVWIKQNPRRRHHQLFYLNENDAFNLYSGIGRWTNSNAELCLLGMKGVLKRQARNVKQIVIAPRRRHSEKPKEVRKRIVELFGDLPRIELFARGNRYEDGWVRVGNEIDGQDIRDYLNGVI